MQVGYARVSTADQSHALQLDALKAAGCERIFTDTASGAKSARPGLEEALAFVRPGDVLVIWRLDRLGRSLRHLIDVSLLLQKNGVELRSLQEGIDTTTAAGKMLFHMMGAVAEFERDLLLERTRAGLSAARARGRKGGRPALDENTKAMIQALAEKPETDVTAACERLGISRATFYRYAGQGGIAAPDALTK